ncbi:MAG: glycosyltransferase [Candidatus Margulisiibacteriota bacterium]
MRIAFFCDSYKPFLSGVTNTVSILTKELRKLGHTVYIIAPGYPGQEENEQDVFRLPSIPTRYPNFRLGIPIIKKIPDIDLVHCHSPFQIGLMGKLTARKRKIPLVYTFHTFFTRYVHHGALIPPAIAKIGIVAYVRAFSNSADKVITPTKMAMRVLKKWKAAPSIEVIPSGVDFSDFPENREETKLLLRKQYNIPISAKVLVCVCRLSKEKNIQFILDAFNKTSADQLVLVGGGPLLEKLQNTNHKLHSKIIIVGNVPYPEVLKYYLIGDIFVYSSLTETQGMVIAEAKHAGLPAVALYSGALADSVRSGIDGYLVPRNMEAFSTHINRLLSENDLRAKMALAALEDAKDRFSSSSVAKRHESVYNFLIKNKKAR